MNTWIVFFVLGCFSALTWSELPSAAIVMMAAISSLFCLKFKRLTAMSGLLAGILWLSLVGYWKLSWQIPDDLVKQPVWVEGQVTSIVLPADSIRFNLQLSRFNQKAVAFNAPVIRLSWSHNSLMLQQGQVVKLRVSLKPAHGLANDGYFNYQQWLFANDIRATGYVIGKADNQIIESQSSIRQRWINRFIQLPLQNSRWLSALTLGYRGLLEQDDWQLAQRTGISHLIAISGLHLGIITTLAYFLFTQLVVRCCPQQINVHRLGMIAAMICALGYSALAGFSLPTMRAWLMVLIVSLVLIKYRHWRPFSIVLHCLLIFMLLMPLSILSVSFWLSFSAVLIIGLIFWCWPIRQRAFSLGQSLAVMCRLQIGLSILMLPVVAWQFGLVSLAAPLVNLVAVPVVTLVLVPLCILALLILCISHSAGLALFAIADQITTWCLSGLTLAGDLQLAAFQVADVGVMAWLFVAVYILLVCIPPLPLPPGLRWLLLLPVLVSVIPVNHNLWRVDVLDVGQGLAVLIQKNHHTLVYDVGPAYPSGFNMADAALLPVLQKRGIDQLDWVFISHQDMDHAGSLEQLTSQLPVDAVLSSHDQCQAGWQQHWQGLTLTALWPEADYAGNENNRSCVLHITDGHHTVLLPGDIEQHAEQLIVENDHSRQYLSADIMVVPHHGSKTSSSPMFINAVNPKYVVFSQGYLNRWHFPAKEVLERYRDSGAAIYSTSQDGQVSFIIAADNITALTYREDVYPYWYANN
ncbi:DNA internalization-related competence protein ComEC/Rec2 [Neptunicella sp. SCSIO 80796]|uniref:DNA internalization-related competence protein ComEC/Rec2 n=1 Tax=Neptunicella plasticusilytica TaxID=3117012 RepID=UPI003A4E4554